MVPRDGTVHHGPLQFDMSFVPAGSTVFMTELLDEETGPDTTFVFNILPGAGHGQQAQSNVGAAYQSSAGGTLPAVVEADLASRKQREKFVFNAGQRAVVEARPAASQLETFSLNSLFPAGRFDIAGGATPVPAATPVTTPPIPAELIGKIAFKSDRTGAEEIYIIDPDGTGLAILTDRWPYNVAQLADTFSAEGRFRVFTKDMVRYKNISDVLTGETIGAKRDDAPALYWYDPLYQVEELLTHFGASIAYEGVWSPTSEQIAFVSNDSGNDEIWVVSRDGAGPRQLTRDDHNWWDKHPSWSPNGSQLVFWSNRTGHGQIWVMDADGNNQYSLSRTGYNDWDPV